MIKGGLIGDGSGSPGRLADIGIKAGRVAEIGDLNGEAASSTLDATGLVVAPGFVDLHTHYDAQLNWDGYATPSSMHGRPCTPGCRRRLALPRGNEMLETVRSPSEEPRR